MRGGYLIMRREPRAGMDGNGHATLPAAGSGAAGRGRRAAPVTRAGCLTARALLGHQTRYAAVGCHHGPQVIQPTR